MTRLASIDDVTLEREAIVGAAEGLLPVIRQGTRGEDLQHEVQNFILEFMSRNSHVDIVGPFGPYELDTCFRRAAKVWKELEDNGAADEKTLKMLARSLARLCGEAPTEEGVVQGITCPSCQGPCRSVGDDGGDVVTKLECLDCECRFDLHVTGDAVGQHEQAVSSCEPT